MLETPLAERTVDTSVSKTITLNGPYDLAYRNRIPILMNIVSIPEN
jgi:hypothetical protein